MRKRLSRWIWPVLTVLAVAGIVVGVARGDFEVVNRWGHTLCTSCIGLGK
ncbi:MAG: thioredoxin [Armatimonadetes bacterium]|nr:thioredoxin [Armatimonadota bacterium]